MKSTIPNSLSASSMAVQTDNLTKSYYGRNVLDNLGLTVPEGSAYALVGPNGAGKTTTFEVLLDVVRADAGHATVFGHDAGSDGPNVRAHIGYLAERPSFGYGWMTVEGLLEHHAAYYPAWDSTYAQTLAGALSIPLRSRFGQLSKGETRRVQLVMCLAHRPPLMLLDEMTDGLDPLIRDRVLGLLIEHMATTPTTVLIATHYIHVVSRLVDHLGVIHNGRMLAQVSCQDLDSRLRRYRARVPEKWQAPELLGSNVVQRNGNAREISWTIWGEEPLVVGMLNESGAEVDDVSRLSVEDATLALLKREEG